MTLIMESMKALRDRIETAKRIIRGNEPEPARVVRKRRPYKRGTKEYLTSFQVGETKKYDGAFRYTSLRSMATHLKKDFGCLFCFFTTSEGKFITRIK